MMIKNRKRWQSLALAAVLTLSLTACGEQETPETPETPEEPTEAVTLRVAALKGPTAMGLVQLMDQYGLESAPAEDEDAAAPAEGEDAEKTPAEGEDAEAPADADGQEVPPYAFTLGASADEVNPLLLKGVLDIACVPANVGALLYNKTQGEIVTLGINTLGVLYLVEQGETIQSLADLKGQTIVAAGKGQTPEYALRYLLTQNGLDPNKDVTIEWKSEHSECVAALASGTATIALLPQPFVTVAQSKIEGLRVAVDLTEAWDALDNGSAMITGVVVARKEVVENHPEAVAAFMEAYADSVEWVNANTAEAAELIGKFGIVEAAVAEKALPHCNIVCITGEEMQTKLSGYLNVLAEQAPESIGGAVPGEDFYN